MYGYILVREGGDTCVKIQKTKSQKYGVIKIGFVCTHTHYLNMHYLKKGLAKSGLEKSGLEKSGYGLGKSGYVT